METDEELRDKRDRVQRESEKMTKLTDNHGQQLEHILDGVYKIATMMSSPASMITFNNDDKRYGKK